MNSYYQIIILIVIGLQVTNASGQSVVADFTEPMPLDESITYGQLDNGLSYYIKHLPKSKDKLDLRFHVLAGKNHQDPDQVNVAHFVEHMGFGESKHFPNGIKAELLERKELDMSQGDINGGTSTHHTYYKFSAPSGNHEALNTGLDWFMDIANGLHFKTDRINSERGVLIQEFIKRQKENLEITYAKNELDVQFSPCWENYSNFIEHHKTFNSDRLIQFYKDWYRPDRMSISIVGQVDDVPTLEKQIRDRFSEIEVNGTPRKTPVCDSIFFNRRPLFAVVEKPEDSLNINEKVEIELYFKDWKTLDVISSEKGMKRLNEIELLVNILNKRLRRTTNTYNSFFDIHIRHTHRATINPSSIKVLISASKNKEKEAIQTFTHISQQLKKYGVLDSEFIKEKERKLDGLERTVSYEQRYWVDEISDHIVYGEALPNDKRGYLKKWLMNYDTSEFNEFINEINIQVPEDIGIFAPTNYPGISENEIRSLISGVRHDSIMPYTKPKSYTTLISSNEVARFNESSYKVRDLGSGTREITLENGIKVVLKSVKTSNSDRKRIVVHGFSDKGALSFPPEDYFSAVNAPDFIKNSGVGAFNKFDLKRFTRNNSLSYQGISHYINNMESGIKLDADVVDFEEVLKLVYLFITQPRKDNLAFEDWKTQQQSYHDQLNDSEKVNLDNDIKKVVGDKSGVSIGEERFLGLEDTDMERSFEIYKDIFGNSQDFTFLVIGDFSMDSVTPLISKYLGNLSSNHPKTLKTPNMKSFSTRPAGPMFVQLRSPDINNKTKTNYTYIPSYYVSIKTEVSWKEKLIARTLGDVLEVKIRALRNNKGYSLYSVTAGGSYNNIMNQFRFSTTLRCTPEDYGILRDEFNYIISDLKEKLVSEEVLEQALKNLRGTEDPSGRGHSIHNIHEKLYNQYRFDVPWIDQKEVMVYIDSITPQDILRAAQNYFVPENLYEFVMTN